MASVTTVACASSLFARVFSSLVLDDASTSVTVSLTDAMGFLKTLEYGYNVSGPPNH
jgi:hypothetical protein